MRVCPLYQALFKDISDFITWLCAQTTEQAGAAYEHGHQQ
jgi:hypothetical protein